MHEQRPEFERKLYQTVLARGLPARKRPPEEKGGTQAEMKPGSELIEERPTSRPLLVSATVIVRNEAHLLEGCVAGLAWCDEIIVLDMRSRDGSAELARTLGAQVYEIDPFPIAEPARIKAAELARNDWVLLIDPDEHMPAALAQDIQEAIRSHPKVGALRLPWSFYFKGELLAGTVWGGPGKTKWCLVHRRRVELLPQCNRLGRVLPGFEEITIAGREDNTVHHYWSNSYCTLLYKHLVRYARLEAEKMYQDGRRWTWRLGFVEPWREFYKSLRHMDGWRIGLRGWLLSAIYGAYTLAYAWILGLYTLRLLRAEERCEPAMGQGKPQSRKAA
jgi:glycosyltransferase involved in cell wall biosynthesis